MEKVQIGRIIEIYKDSLLLASEVAITRVRLPRGLEIAVGDWLEFSRSSHETSIIRIQDRKSSLEKLVNKKKKIVVSNIDAIAIMASSKPKLSRFLVDKWLALSHINNLDCIMIFNKSDRQDFKEVEDDISLYENLGIKCFRVSAKHNQGIEKLKHAILRKSIALVGLSGVGKSSLIKILTGDDIKTQALSRNTGKHTTTTTRIYTGENFELVDTPGAGDINLECFDKSQIISGFAEIHASSLLCKFSNCNHAPNDKGCNVIKSLNEGMIKISRYENLMQQINEKK
ncbi:MAG: ribosome small subunit-dependent GTPase A [Gammaproteobacteria bacterium]